MSSQFWTSAGLGAVVAGLIWAVMPGAKENASEVEAKSQQDLVSSSKRRSVSDPRELRGRGQQLVEDFKAAKTIDEKLAAIAQVERMSRKELQAALEEYPDDKEVRDWPFAMKVMILRLAEIDPAAAVAFVMDDPREADGEKENVERKMNGWQLIAGEWAARDSLGFVEFLKENREDKIITRGLHSSDLEENLLAGDPLGFVTHYHTTNIDFYEPKRFASTLKLEGDFRRVLNTWKKPFTEGQAEWQARRDASPSKSRVTWEERVTPQRNSLVQAVIERWRERDEESFLKSEFADWEAAKVEGKTDK